MSTRSRAFIVLAVAFLPSACGSVRLPDFRWPSALRWPTAPGGRPVALLMEGSAFSPPARARTARELEHELGRPVGVLETLPTAMDGETKALATRVVGERGLAYDWREPQCAWDRVLLAGVTRGVDAVYRAVLESSEHERPATDQEWEDLGKGRLGFRRLVERPLVREEVLTGTVTRSALVSKDGMVRTALHRGRVALATDEERIDVGVAVAEAVHGLGALPEPEWEALARRQLKQGCPFLALAIADTQLASGTREPVQSAAIAAMRPSPERRAEHGSAARRPAPAREVERTAAAARPTPELPQADEEPAAAEGASCHALCEMHMVEICNTDKVLWSAHRVRWEPTPCGTRREEPFLAQCYQEQWDTGTFETSCVQPCEASDEGRGRLMAILQEAGCVSDPGQS